MTAIGFIEVAAVAQVIQSVIRPPPDRSRPVGRRQRRRRPHLRQPGLARPRGRPLRVLLLLVAVVFPIVSAGRDLAWLYPLMFAAVLACAPAAAALTTSFSMAGTAATQAGSFAWLASSTSLGGSAGDAAAWPAHPRHHHHHHPDRRRAAHRCRHHRPAKNPQTG